MDDIIRQHTPKDYRSEYVKTILPLAMLGIIIFVATKTFIVPIIFIILGLILPFIRSKTEDETFDGWLIEDEKIILSKNSRTGPVTKTLYFRDLLQIKYSCGFRRARPTLFFSTIDAKNRLTLPYDSFKMASTLKHFQHKGLQVELLKGDAELRKYLDGHIDKIPMTNM